MTVKQQVQAQSIYRVLFTQDFSDFYGEVKEGDEAPFARHLEGDEDCMDKEEILQEICDLFRLPF